MGKPLSDEYRYSVSVGDVVLWRKKVWVVIEVEFPMPVGFTIEVGIVRSGALGIFRRIRRLYDKEVDELDPILRAKHVPVHKVIERG
jgi:hypothetical protein